MNKFYTDYPIVEFGDKPGCLAPIREVKILSDDGNKYSKILVGGIQVEIKTGYIYSEPRRFK